MRNATEGDGLRYGKQASSLPNVVSGDYLAQEPMCVFQPDVVPVTTE